MIDLVHDVEALFHLPYLVTASGNLFCKLQFRWYHSYFRKDFQMLLAVNTDHVLPPHRALGQVLQQQTKKFFFRKLEKK